MKILLITPPCSLEDRYGANIKINRGFLPPLGLAYLASVLEKEKHKIQILDLQVYNYTLDEILEECRKFNPDLIGFSTLINVASKAFKIAGYLKEKLNIPIIFGGPHVSCFPKKILEENTFIDVIVIGEGELTFKELVDAYAKGRSLKNIAGIFYRDKDKIIENKFRDGIANLDDLPIPTRKYYDMSRYIPLPNQYLRLPITNMITARGCSYGKCTFCFEGGRLGHKYRRISPKRAIEEIKYLISEYGIKEISFWDDEFVVGKKWVIEFCDLLKENNIDIKWSCCARVNYVDEEILKKMASAGCWNVFFGLESGNQELLNKINKNITLEQSKNAVKWAHDACIQVRGSFMLALPGETPEMAEKTIQFAIDLDLDYVQFLFTTPYFGTKLYEQCKEEGKIISENLDDYSIFKVVYLPKGYSFVEQLIKIQKSAYRRFYFRPKYAMKHIKRLKNFSDIKKYWLGFRFALGMSH